MTDGLVQRCDLARRIAREAGAILMTYYGRLERVEQKGDVDFVTEADEASEAFLVDAIRTTFPNDAILAEEGTSISGESPWTWVVDPLDGTTNFVHTFPLFMVSLGLLHGDERVGGVCYGPVYDDEFWAAKGQGAFHNNQPIHVSTTDQLSKGLLATGFPYNRREIVDELLASVRRVICNAHGVRRCGAASYDQCFLASGRIDGFFERGLQPWDLAAGTVIIEEAGGRVTAGDGSAFDLMGSDVLASNGRIHDAICDCILEPVAE